MKISVKLSAFIVSLILSSTLAANTHLCSEDLKSQKGLFASTLAKYNTETVLKYSFSPEGLDMTRNLYHQLPVSPIVKGIISAEDPQHNLIKKEIPEYFVWNKTHDTFLSINPTYLAAEKLLKAVTTKKVRKIKNEKDGLTLVSWWVHPELEARIKSQETAVAKVMIAELEKKGLKYLASILDLQKSDLPYLKELKKLSLEHLKTKFGVTDADQIRLDFHFPYAIENATLHLHVRVNQQTHPLELAKSYSIDDVIHYLETGRTVKELILDRQASLGGFYFSMDARGILSQIPGGQLSEVQNPFRQKIN